MPAPAFLTAGRFRSAWIWAVRLLLLAYFAAGALILLGRYVLMPEIAAQREWIAERLGAAIGLPVELDGLDAAWPGLHPRLVIEGLRIRDAQGQTALALGHVEAEIGWTSLLFLELRLHRLDIRAPALELRRDAKGGLWVAGLPMQGSGDGNLAAWLLEQRRIVVRDAQIRWIDERRGAPALDLDALHFDLRNFAGHHSFGLHAKPQAAGAGLLDVRGNLSGRDLADLADWQGELYAELGQADIAVWSQWVDLPLEMTHGQGSMKLWLEFERALPLMLTADLHLTDFSLRLRPDLPRIDLTGLDGRIVARRTDHGYAGELRRLGLTTRQGIVVPPLTAQLGWATGGRRAGGSLSIDRLDLGMLAALALHLPLPDHALERIANLTPRGEVTELALRWQGEIEAPTSWSAQGKFAGLALAPHRELPGFSGISGHFNGTEQAGEVFIDSTQVRLELPAVFPEPTLSLAQLQVEAGWRARDDGLAFQLVRAQFSNDDATGEASGSYLFTGGGLGVIDLSARLHQAAGNAVWRYMPLVVNTDARDWLRAGITGGISDETTLRLKGPLEAFPYADGKQGIFQVKGTIRNASLNYAEGWPQITGIDGDLLFEGVKMQIRGKRGEIMGVALSDIVAEIPHLDAYEEQLIVTGKAQGPTQRFLDFIEASPVGGMIDHFTAPMRADGKGSLDLRLDMPLRQIDKTRVQGKYRFADNRLTVLPALPPLTKAQGEFVFTENRLEGKNLRANLFDGPVSVGVTSGTGGVVKVEAKGTLAAAGLRQAYPHPALEHLSGEAKWSSSIRVKPPGAEVRIESSLEGLSSSLPVPFNKSVLTALPLRLDGRIDRGNNRDEWNGKLGGIAALKIVSSDTLRGGIGIGQPVPTVLPPQGLALGVSASGLDADAWRRVLASASKANNGAQTQSEDWAVTAFELRSRELLAWGRHFHELRLTGNKMAGRWQLGVDSREARGQLSWDDAGNGKLSGRLTRLQVPAADAAMAVPGEAPGRSAELRMPPDIEVQLDDFQYGDMKLGELRITAGQAEKAVAEWQAALMLRNEAAQLTGHGRWLLHQDRSALDFKLAVDDAEKLLGRLGLADAVRRGSGRIEGALSWPGTPDDFALAALSGKLSADFGKGQFKKLEPGVGRLLGVLSLQSLPRRITLDFRDIFSEGFAFDSIVGQASMAQGVLQTDELRIRGPAAKILLSGQVSLPAETQDLRVRVQPALGETVAVGAMIAHPVAGAVAWLAQKALNDPLDQVFAYEYTVSGGWKDPKVEKATAATPSKGALP